MPDAIKKALAAIRMQFDLPANLRGDAIHLLRDFDPDKMAQLQHTIQIFRKG